MGAAPPSSRAIVTNGARRLARISRIESIERDQRARAARAAGLRRYRGHRRAILPDGAHLRAGHPLRLPDYASDAAGRAAVSRALIDALVELHGVDCEPLAWGISASRKGTSSGRYGAGRGQLEKSRQRPLPDLDAVSAWLVEHLPVSGAATIVHGDFRLDNAMFASDHPRVVAIFDWKMSTIGDPLADLGYLLSHWHEPGRPGAGIRVRGLAHHEAAWLPLARRTNRVLCRMHGPFGTRHGLLHGAGDLEAGDPARRQLPAPPRRHDRRPIFEQLEAGVPALARQALHICQQA